MTVIVIDVDVDIDRGAGVLRASMGTSASPVDYAPDEWHLRSAYAQELGI